MGKIKSAICLTLITLIIAVLCVTCFVPFPLGDGIHYYNPIINWTEKSADLGGFQYGGSDPDYLGGGYSVVLYPEGVISKKEYEDNLADKSAEDSADYIASYVPYADGTIYLDKETVCDGGSAPSEEFKEAFANRVEILNARYERIYKENLKMEVCDDYTVRIFLPATMDSAVASFLYFSYMGDVTVYYGADSESGTRLFPDTGKKAQPITDYIKGVTTRRAADGTYAVAINFTKEGAEIVTQATSAATDESTDSLIVLIGEEQIISLTVTSPLTGRTLYVTSSSYTSDSAAIVSAVLDTAVKYASDYELKMSMGELYRMTANFGDNALIFAYIAFAVCFAAMMVYFLVRYRRLAFAHMYTYLIFLLAMVLCIWQVSAWSVGTIAALAITSVLLSVCDAISYEYARKEYATGKTMASSVKAGYKKCFWHIFDIHIVLAIVAALVYFIALTELQAFALVFILGTLFSGVCTLAVNRFMWYITMPFAKDAGKFCHFKREEVEDDE